MSDNNWGEPPAEYPAPRGGTWLGPWERGTAWDTSMPKTAPWKPYWIRHFLEHDGHEECCGHTDFVMVPANQARTEP